MKKITQNLRWLVTLLTMIVSVGAWAQAWVETDPSELVTGDIVVIADKTSSTAMSNDKGTSSAPLATAVTIEDEEITSVVTKNLQWEVTVTDDGEFMFGVGENYLYCNNTNNGVRVGTNTNNLFTIYDNAGTNFLLNSATSRYVGVYKNNNGEPQDWRCYTSINTNINQCVTAFYKRVESSTPPVTITITISDEKLTNKDVYVGTNAGKLSATVKEGDTTIDNPSITWTSSNESVATISTMGAVTLVAAGTTTITATYNGYTAEYELVVTNSAPQITDFTVTLNNTFFGTEYSGSASGITDANPERGTKNNVTIVYAGSGNHYINNSQIRFYPNNKLTFTAPEGYVFTKIEFTKSDTWACTITSIIGTVTDNTTWTGQANEVVLTGSGSSRCDMTDVAITLAKQHPYTLTIGDCENAEIYVFYNDDQTNSIANSDDMLSNDNVLSNSEILISASAKEGYVLQSVTVTDGNGDNISLNDVEGEEEGTAWTFIMPESNVTISCTVNEVVPAEKLTFVKVTSTADLVAGGEYIIVCESENKVMTSYGVGSSKVFNQEGITINNSTVTIEEGVANILTLGGTTDAWTLQTSLEGKYVSLVSSSNALNCQENVDDYIYWTITFNGGNCVISSNEFNTRTIRYNSGSPRFAAYTSGQQDIQLYKKETSPSVTIGDSKWATYVAEDNVTFPSEVSAYTVETIDSENSKVALGEVIAVKKGTPILVYSETPNTYTLEVVEEEDCDDTFNNKLKVSDGVTGDGATIYALANKDNVVGFYPVASNVIIPAGKAYLEIIESKAPVKGFFALGGVADAINNIAVETANGTIFNIAGQKVQNITKGGLYIVNGKKVIVK